MLKAIRTVLIPNQYEVHALSDDSVTKVLSDNLGIQNDRVLEQIKIIAKGNIRLAIMAGMCALNGKFGSIQNAFDIFNDYYGDIIGEFDRNEILVAAIIAFFDKFNLKETELPFNIALQHGISTVQFRDMCLSLHRKEVISIFDDKAVKFENQNLRDYLLYYAFFKEKWLSPCDLICQAFPTYKNRVVFAFNTLVRLFNSPENIAFIEGEIRAAWTKVKKLPTAIAFEFVATFYNAKVGRRENAARQPAPPPADCKQWETGCARSQAVPQESCRRCEASRSAHESHPASAGSSLHEPPAS